MSKAKVLVVEDQFIVGEDISRSLKKLGYTVCGVATNSDDALKLSEECQPDVVLMDIRIKGERDGIQTATLLKEKFGISVIYLTAHSDEATLERATATNPLGYLLKPFEERQLYTTIEMALNKKRTDRRDFIAKHPEITAAGPSAVRLQDEFAQIIGNHPSLLKLLEGTALVAKTEVTVHIYGENGTGKELIADAIHRLSERRSERFVKINCSAIPSALLESALFGHSKGAFTGAIKDQEGFIEHADRGTLFLDEIGDLSQDLQVKLLRVLQSREYSKVGENQIRKADIRIITATNKKLKDLVGEGKIREDFYYRINVFPLVVPALRDRHSDIILIADHFRELFNRMFSKNVKGFSDDAQAVLLRHRWPGNVRELENAMRHAFVIVQGDTIRAEHLPLDVRAESEESGIDSSPTPKNFEAVLELDGDEAEERKLILDALKKAGGSKGDAAKILGYSRVTLWKKMARLGL